MVYEVTLRNIWAKDARRFGVLMTELSRVVLATWRQLSR
jgi:hypothetical protein